MHLGGQPHAGKSSFAMIFEAERIAALEVTSTEKAIEVVESALRAIAPWPEVVTVHDPLGYEPRLLGERDRGYMLTRADGSKARAIRLAVKSALGPVVLVRLPDLLLAVDGRAVTSIWDDTVRQAVED
jgi:hypothetical protein